MLFEATSCKIRDDGQASITYLIHGRRRPAVKLAFSVLVLASVSNSKDLRYISSYIYKGIEISSPNIYYNIKLLIANVDT
jgi:hypothetical protein